MTAAPLWLIENVRLPDREGLWQIAIDKGRFGNITPMGEARNESYEVLNARGGLAIPPFIEPHIHLDTTQTAGQPAWNQSGTLFEGIERWAERKALLTHEDVKQRAWQTLKWQIANGVQYVRTHVDVSDPTLTALRAMLEVKQEVAPWVTLQIVAFPQHGLLHSKVDGLMREAMQMGVQYVGGLDPTNVDGAMEKSLDAMFQIALDTGKGVDIHLHETSPAGVAAINYMIATVEKNPALRGKVTISHAFALTVLNPSELEETASRLAAQQITIASTVPIGGLMMPLPQLSEKGVFVMTGTDSVIDHWSPFGSGDILEKANLYAQLYRGSDEFHLSRAMAISTGGVLPLNDKGQRVWPQAGDNAEFVLVNASCSAEAVARLPARTATFHQGRLVAGQVGKA
ncbi:MAG: amidohydrolase [Klebsiella grimontii]|nr:amidohydrolase [Klebsiella grimontii]